MLLWLLMESLKSKGTVYYSDGFSLLSRKAIYLSFNPESMKGEYRLYVSRGLKVLGGEIAPSKVIEIAVNVARRTARFRGRRRGRSPARTIDYVIPRGKTFKLALAPTLRRAAATGHWPRIRWEDLREALRSDRQRVSIIIVLDSSASMTYSILGIVSALKAIGREAGRHRDRVALVVCKGFGAAVIQHPTTNFNQVIGKLSMVGLDDFTPLASGMYKGYTLALRERKRGYAPVIVIISDGNVNVPLPRRISSRVYSPNPAIQSVFEVAERILRDGIETVVVNTKHVRPTRDLPSYVLTGTDIMLGLASMTRGSYVGIR